MTDTAAYSRRSFSARLALFASSLVASLALPARLVRARSGAAPAPAADPKHAAPRWGMAIDLDRCTGCGACAVACRTENNVALIGPEPELRGAQIQWMALLEQPAQEDRPGDRLPLPCMHCDNPPCVKVCPVNATYQTDEGIVAQIWDRCIGCRYCEVACPYGRRYFNFVEPEWPESYTNYLNPDVATRPQGVVEKCTFCQHRVRAAQEEARVADRTLADHDVQRLPACARSCPAEAIVFGDLNDETSAVSRQSASPRAFRLLEHLGTRPKVTYLSRDRRS
jgi:molybdopterin-containing oxidoreductase family iron-sulfur binding subunit